MIKLTDFSQEHAFEHVKSGCWSLKMFKQWMAAVSNEYHIKGYDAGWDDCSESMENHGGYGV